MFAFNKTDALVFEFDFAVFLPRHIMSELIVQRHTEIDDETVWQSGVIFKHKRLNAHALGHFYTSYKDAEHLKLQFTNQLKLMLVQGKLG